MIQHNAEEIKNNLLSSGIVEAGGSVTRADAEKVYYIGEVFGTVINIDDADGNTIIDNISTHRFYPALKLEKGFEITGTDLSVRFIELPGLEARS